MKKMLCSLLVCILLLSAAPLSGMGAEASFTLMIYLCGTDLETDAGMATSDLAEMVRSRIPEGGRLTLYVQTGGTNRWQIGDISGGGQAERWLVSENGLVLVESVGKADMGAESTLCSFIQSGYSRYPADRYGLILWDHGAGAAGGICYDETTGNTLSMTDVYTALDKAGSSSPAKRFAFVGFDACLMATFEMACHLQPFADYMIASEELEPGTGWSYNSWLPALVQNPGLSVESIGPMVVDTFIQASVAADRNEYATLSLINLQKLDPLRTALEGLATTLESRIDAGDLAGISRVRQNVRSFGEIFDSASDMVDLGVFASAYRQYDPENAQSIVSALQDVVVYQGHTANLTNLTGLSVLVPYATRQEASGYLPFYDAHNLYPQYATFVKGLVGGMSSGSYTFHSTGVTQQDISQAQEDWFSQYSQSPGDSWDSLLGGLFSGWEDDSGWWEEDGSAWDNAEGWTSGSDSASPWDSPASGSPSSPQDGFSMDSFLDGLFYGDGSSASVTGSNFAQHMEGETPPQDATMDVETQDGSTITVANPFAGNDSPYAYVATLTQEEMQHLATAEANLMMDVSDPDFECYVELGYVQDVMVDWRQGKIYGLFDGTWPTLDGQMVCMYDQIANDSYIRSLIPVTINGAESYLLVIFDQDNPYGRVAGFTEGYTDAGMPVRGYTQLSPGDIVVPQYELLYWDDNGTQQYEPFEGDPIAVGADGTVPFAYDDVETGVDYAYAFCLNDVFGSYQFTDFVTLSF